MLLSAFQYAGIDCQKAMRLEIKEIIKIIRKIRDRKNASLAIWKPFVHLNDVSNIKLLEKHTGDIDRGPVQLWLGS